MSSLKLRALARLARFAIPALAILGLTACVTPEPSPTPTATRTPILPTPTPTLTPSATPTPTPTPTLTPSPTLPPGLVLPPTPVASDVCPPMPTDLHFLRDGKLWVCLAEGGTLDQIPVAEAAQGTAILDYRIAADRRYVAYVTDAGELFVLDRARREHQLLPTSGRLLGPTGVHFAVTGDSIIYLAWDVQPMRGALRAVEGGSGTILALDITTPAARQQELGFCNGMSDRLCMGFSLAPEQDKLAFVDGHGIWITALDTAGASEVAGLTQPVGTPQLIAAFEDNAARVRDWSPNGEWLLVDSRTIEAPSLGLIPVAGAEQTINTTAICAAPCALGTSWDDNGLWVTWDTAAQGCVGWIDLVTPDVQTLAATNPPCGVQSAALHPRSPHVVADRGLTFLHWGDEGHLGLPPGLYALTSPTSGEPTPLALLSQADAQGSTLWSPSGKTFLLLDSTGVATTLGVLDQGMLWDVRALLQGAHAFRWGAPDTEAAQPPTTATGR